MKQVSILLQVREKYQWMAAKMAELFPGVITFHAFQSPGNPSEWQCVELYASQEVFKRHVSDTEELQKWAMDFRPLIVSFSADVFVEGEEMSKFVKQRAAMQKETLHPSGSWAGFALNPSLSIQA